jgi:hypothetical protein
MKTKKLLVAALLLCCTALARAADNVVDVNVFPASNSGAVKPSTLRAIDDGIGSLIPAVILVDANGTPVSLSGGGSGGLTDTQLRAAAVPVSAASLPLPAGASTEATLALIKAKTDNLDVALSTRTKPADTQPVSAASLPLPAGAAADATLTGGTQQTKITDGTNVATVKAASTAAGATDKAVVVAVSPNNTIAATESGTWTVQPGNTANTTARKVDGSAVTQPVSAASLPLPSGASTSAKQPAIGTAGSASADVITVQGATSMTPLKVDGSGVTQPVSGTTTANQGGTWTVQPGNTANTTAWKVDGSAVTNQENVTQFGGTNIVTGLGASGAGIPRVTISSDTVIASNVTQASITKGTQSTKGVTTQNLKDAGRGVVFLQIDNIAAVATEALISYGGWANASALSAGVNAYVVTAGKTFRMTSLVVTGTGSAASTQRVRVRALATTCVIGSPAYAGTGIVIPAASAGGTSEAVLPDGVEIPAGFAIGISAIGATTNTYSVFITGFEY